MTVELSGQSKATFVFYDACTSEILELSYSVSTFKPDSAIKSDVENSVYLSPNYYQLETDITWNEMYTVFTFDVYMNEQERSDTLFLQSARFFGPTYLHAPPEEFRHYCCGELCNGLIEDIDYNGVTRFEGNFKNGLPTRNLKYYNSSGKRINTEIYVGGQFVRNK